MGQHCLDTLHLPDKLTEKLWPLSKELMHACMSHVVHSRLSFVSLLFRLVAWGGCYSIIGHEQPIGRSILILLGTNWTNQWINRDPGTYVTQIRTKSLIWLIRVLTHQISSNPIWNAKVRSKWRFSNSDQGDFWA